ncbi:MAG: arylesterase [Herbaspirillum sp.]
MWHHQSKWNALIGALLVALASWLLVAGAANGANKAVNNAATAASAHSASKTVLVLGDSLSAEYGLARDSGWVKLLEQRLAKQHIKAKLINASISGETSSGGLVRLPGLLQLHKPDLVIIELGANDALRGLSLAATEDNLHTIISLSQRAHAKILLVGMQIPPNYGRTYSDQFKNLYSKLAHETKSALVPFFMEKIADQPQLFQADRLHPTAAAQPLLLDTVWPYLKPLLRP